MWMDRKCLRVVHAKGRRRRDETRRTTVGLHMLNISTCRVMEGMPRAMAPAPAIREERLAARTL